MLNKFLAEFWDLFRMCSGRISVNFWLSVFFGSGEGVLWGGRSCRFSESF
jgi:hypothetical protein